MNCSDDEGRSRALAGLIENALSHLGSAGYGAGVQCSYRSIWWRFLKWTQLNESQDVLPDLVSGYRAHLGIESTVAGERGSCTAARARSALSFLEDFGRHLCRWPRSGSKRDACVACSIDALVEGATAEVIRLGYRKSSRVKFSTIWHSFGRFAARTAPEKLFSQELSTRFLGWSGMDDEKPGASTAPPPSLR